MVDDNLTKETVKATLQKQWESPDGQGNKHCVVWSGHGEQGSGDWICSDGSGGGDTVSFEELYGWWGDISDIRRQRMHVVPSQSQAPPWKECRRSSSSCWS